MCVKRHTEYLTVQTLGRRPGSTCFAMDPCVYPINFNFGVQIIISQTKRKTS